MRSLDRFKKHQISNYISTNIFFIIYYLKVRELDEQV